MRISTKLAAVVGAIGLAATGALVAFGAGPAAAHGPALVRLAATTQSPGQVGPAAPAASGAVTTVEASSAEAPSGAEASEPASEPQLPGAGHGDPTGHIDHQFTGTE